MQKSLKISKKRIATISSVLIILLSASWWLWAASPIDKNDQNLEFFEVKKGESVRQVAKNLKTQGLIKDPIAFFIIVRFNDLGKNIQAGDFELSKQMTPQKIAGILTHGKKDVKITIAEGLRKEEIAEKIKEKIQINQEEFLSLAKEGYLFPDTYLFPKEASESVVIKILQDNFDRKVDQKIKQEIIAKDLTLEKTIILASIVERETKFDTDRPIVAGILLKRLKNDWPLEVDATIQYALGYQNKERTWWKENLSENDLMMNSPYNTRLQKGLPPTPISNPGLSTIKAVIDPKESPYWFYLSDEKGEIHYSKTLEEHNLQIQRFLRGA